MPQFVHTDRGELILLLCLPDAPSRSVSSFPPPHVFGVEQTRASLPLSSRLIEDVRGTARTCHGSKQCIRDDVSVCVVCMRVLPSTQILGGTLPGSHCGVRVCVCWCELPGTRVLGGMVVCDRANVGCHYLFLGIGWLSCLRTDGFSVSWKKVEQPFCFPAAASVLTRTCKYFMH